VNFDASLDASRKIFARVKKIATSDQVKTLPSGTSPRIARSPGNYVFQNRRSQNFSNGKTFYAKNLQFEPNHLVNNVRGKGKIPESTEPWGEWFLSITNRGVRVSGPVLKTKVKGLAKKTGNERFIATGGWSCRWKDRHEMHFFFKSKFWSQRAPTLNGIHCIYIYIYV